MFTELGWNTIGCHVANQSTWKGADCQENRKKKTSKLAFGETYAKNYDAPAQTVSQLMPPDKEVRCADNILYTHSPFRRCAVFADLLLLHPVPRPVRADIRIVVGIIRQDVFTPSVHPSFIVA